MKRDKVLSTLKKFEEANKKKYGIRRIGIFGSLARGTAISESDIDVVVELENPDLFNLIGIKQDLEDIFHSSVDILRYRDNMNEFLKRRIENEALYV